MRSLAGIAAVVLLLGLNLVSAQHGGGHVSAGGHGGMAAHGGFGGHAGGRGFGGAHSGGGFASHPGAGFSSRSSGRAFSNHSLSSRNFNHRGIRIRTRDFRNNCFWYGCGWGYGYPYLNGGIDPYWWWDSGSQDDPDQQYGGGAYSQNYDGRNYSDDPPRNGQGDQDAYARPAPPQPRPDVNAEAAPATVLVFRDQHKQEVKNYAIVGQTLWTFDPQRKQKIPLTDLDLPATTKANDERGVDFRVPGA